METPTTAEQKPTDVKVKEEVPGAEPVVHEGVVEKEPQEDIAKEKPDDTMSTTSDSTIEVDGSGGTEAPPEGLEPSVSIGLQDLMGLLSNMAKSDESNEMLAAVKAGLDSFELNYKVHDQGEGTTNPNQRVITFGLNCKTGPADIVILVNNVEDKYCYYQKYKILVPEEHRAKAALYLTYVNYGLAQGNFEMDLNDGEIRFKNSCQVNGSKLSTEMVKAMLGHSVGMYDRFFPGLMATIYGGKEPKEAYEDCMKDQNKPEPAEAQ